MRNTYALMLLGALVILPTVSIAELRYQLGSLLQEPSWIVLLTIFLFIAIGYVYFEGRKIDLDFDRKYQMIGQKGGKAKKNRQTRRRVS